MVFSKRNVHSERKTLSHHQSRRHAKRFSDGRASQERRCGGLFVRCRQALRLESLPGSPAEAVQDPRRPAKTEEGEVVVPPLYGSRARKTRRLRMLSCATSGSGSIWSFCK